MIFIAGMVCGAVAALVLYSCFMARNSMDAKIDEPDADSERLNAEKKEHERFMREQQRQFDQLMKYNGKEQRA